MTQWHQARELGKHLASEGWSSPNTYDNCFDEAGDFPAVYLFQIHDVETYERGLVAYVGQSKKLKTRWSGHEIIREISAPGYWVKKWFKRTPENNLDEVELKYIQRFDPPWNIQGRVRGVMLP